MVRTSHDGTTPHEASNSRAVLAGASTSDMPVGYGDGYDDGYADGRADEHATQAKEGLPSALTATMATLVHVMGNSTPWAALVCAQMTDEIILATAFLFDTGSELCIANNPLMFGSKLVVSDDMTIDFAAHGSSASRPEGHGRVRFDARDRRGTLRSVTLERVYLNRSFRFNVMSRSEWVRQGGAFLDSTRPSGTGRTRVRPRSPLRAWGVACPRVRRRCMTRW